MTEKEFDNTLFKEVKDILKKELEAFSDYPYARFIYDGDYILFDMELGYTVVYNWKEGIDISHEGNFKFLKFISAVTDIIERHSELFDKAIYEYEHLEDDEDEDD